MKKFKYLMGALLISTQLVGCSGGDNDVATGESVKTSITVQVEDGWLPHYEQAIERVLEKNPNAEIIPMEIGSFDIYELIDATDMSNEDIPDVFAAGGDAIQSFALNDILASIDAPCMAKSLGGWDNFEDGLSSAFYVDENYIGFPFNIETVATYANTANAAANGIDLTQPIEFSELAPTDILLPITGAYYGVAFTNAVDLTLLDVDENGEFFSDLTKDFSDLTQAQQDVFSAMFDYWKSHDELATELWDYEAIWGYRDISFTSGGPTSLRIDGPWVMVAMDEKTNGGQDLDILPLSAITINGTPLKHWKSGWGLVANVRIEEDPAKVELAQELIKEIVNPEYAQSLFEATGKILENVSVEDYQSTDLPEIDKKIIAAMIESYNQAIPQPRMMEWNQVWPTWESGLLSWANVKPKNVEEAYAQIQASFSAMMSTLSGS